jgi:hypothetical protein
VAVIWVITTLVTLPGWVRAEYTISMTGGQCAEGCDCPGCQSYFQQQQQMAPAPAQPTAPQDLQGQPGQPPAAPDVTAPLSPSDVPMTAPGAAAAQPSFDFSSSLAAGTGSALASAGVPSMIGDFFGNGFQYQVFNNASVTSAGGDRIFKFAENNSPFPRDRVFFNFHHFHNALTDTRGDSRDLSRYTFGIESTIFNQRNSIEFRVPFSGTLDTSQDLQATDLDSTEFGNLALALKHLVFADECTALAVGTGIVFPTGDDSVIEDDGFAQIIFGNDAVHFQPFVGYYRAPTSRLFTQFFAQLDIDANGNDVVVPQTSRFSVLSVPETNVLQDQTLLMLDYSVGYWLYRNPHACYVTALAPMIELHYTTTLDDQDVGTLGRMFVPINRRDVLNLTGGLFFQLGPMSGLKIAAVSPLRDDFDKLFDVELGVQFVRLF